MGQGAGSRFLLVWSASLFLCAAKVALASTEPPPQSTPRSLRQAEISIPSELAYLSTTPEPQDSRTTSIHPTASVPLLIHIQEAHNNYEGQKNLAALLDWLVKAHGLKLILVEGGEGNVSLAYLRDYGPPDNRREVAEGFLKQGLISGEEYLDIVSEAPLILWGVEERKRYRRNIETFLETEGVQEAAKASLREVRRAAEALTPLVFEPALREVEAQAKAYHDGTLGLAAYAQALAARAKTLGMPDSDAPHVHEFLAVHQAEAAIEMAQVPLEQRRLIEQLKATLGEATVAPLIANAGQVKAGALRRELFFLELEQLIDRAKIPLAEFPNLARYLPYVQRRSRLDASALADELDRLTQAVRTATASTEAGRMLLAILDQVDLMDKLVELRLSPEEYARLSAMDREAFLAQGVAFLGEQSARHGVPALSTESLTRLQEALPTFDRFYEAARDREQALVERTVAKLRDTGEPLAVLITGGFHAPRLREMVREQGIAMMVVTPKIGEESSDALYRAVLKFKVGHGSLDEVRGLAAKREQHQ